MFKKLLNKVKGLLPIGFLIEMFAVELIEFLIEQIENSSNTVDDRFALPVLRAIKVALTSDSADEVAAKLDNEAASVPDVTGAREAKVLARAYRDAAKAEGLLTTRS